MYFYPWENYYIFFIISLFISACSLKKVVKHHGVHFLEKKQAKLTVNQSNKNDILKLLGSPSTKSTFDNDFGFILKEKLIIHLLQNLVVKNYS